METPANSIESLIERIEAYIKTTLTLSKYKILEAVITVATSVMKRLSVIIMLSLCVLILNIGIALFLGELLGKSYYGFFIIAAFYLLAGTVLHFFPLKWFKRPVSDIILRQAIKQE
jgi:uncharacterized membrane protein YgdD (TMEM256/DUF423 family)